MGILLTGNYRRSLDEKGRLSVPKPYRDLLDFPDKSNLYITPGIDRCLAIYTQEVLEALGNCMARSNSVAHENRAFSRLFYAQAQIAEIDRQGRMRIPPELSKLANLTVEVVVVGVRDHLELWNAADWDHFLGQTQSKYDQLAEKALTEIVTQPANGMCETPVQPAATG